jgi:hypothetical protein
LPLGWWSLHPCRTGQFGQVESPNWKSVDARAFHRTNVPRSAQTCSMSALAWSRQWRTLGRAARIRSRMPFGCQLSVSEHCPQNKFSPEPSGSPLIESAHDLHELASQQDERAPQYEGDAIE